MKNLQMVFSRAILLLALVQLTSCQKLIDKIFHGGNEDKKCRIALIRQTLGSENEFRTGTVYYNSHNDPDSVIFDIATGSAGAHLFYFIYDDQHRLIEYRGDYSYEPDDYYFKHTYVYHNGRVITDTSRLREAGSATVICDLEYDSQGRVVKEERLWIEGDGEPMNEPLEPLVYSYDEDGNLASGNVSYDNKKSFLRTNKNWMFTQRNYSENNPAGATGYNTNGYPLGFTYLSQGPNFLQFGLPLEIEYDCN